MESKDARPAHQLAPTKPIARFEGRRSSESTIPIIFGCSEEYSVYAAIAAASVLAHAESNIEILCLVPGLSSIAQRAFQSLSARFATPVEIIQVDESVYAAWKDGRHETTVGWLSRMTKNSYIRLLAPSQIDRPRAVYFDTDVVITTDITPMFSAMPTGDDVWIAGGPDVKALPWTSVKRADSDPYVNSGVLVMNLEAMRKGRFVDKVIRYYNENSRELFFFDQDILNGVCKDKILMLDRRWNLLAADHGEYDLQRHYGRYEGSGILHGSGVAKPWMDWCDPWLGGIWASYVKLTGLRVDEVRLKPETLEQWSLKARSLDVEGKTTESTRIRSQLIDRMQVRIRKLTKA